MRCGFAPGFAFSILLVVSGMGAIFWMKGATRLHGAPACPRLSMAVGGR